MKAKMRIYKHRNLSYAIIFQSSNKKTDHIWVWKDRKFPFCQFKKDFMNVEINKIISPLPYVQQVHEKGTNYRLLYFTHSCCPTAKQY